MNQNHLLFTVGSLVMLLGGYGIMFGKEKQDKGAQRFLFVLGVVACLTAIFRPI